MLFSAEDKSISHITCPAPLVWFPIPQATGAGYLWAYDIALTFPALYAAIMCHLMKRYTLVTIIRLDTGASGMYQIPASRGGHLGNMARPTPTSLSHFSALPKKIFSTLFFFPFSKTPPEACLTYISSLPVCHALTFWMQVSQWRDMCRVVLSFRTVIQLLCLSWGHDKKG